MSIGIRPEVLSLYLSRFPAGTASVVAGYFDRFSFRLIITKPRKQKLGSFRAPLRRELPVIRLNEDLGSYSFLIVFIHELAHLQVWEMVGRRAQPHGKEWKAAFYRLMEPLMSGNILPSELVSALEHYFIRTPATLFRDTRLMKVLNHLEHGVSTITLKEIQHNTAFQLMDGRKMVKLERLRTRYKCYCLKTRRYYLVSGSAQIFPEDGK